MVFYKSMPSLPQVVGIVLTIIGANVIAFLGGKSETKPEEPEQETEAEAEKENNPASPETHSERRNLF